MKSKADPSKKPTNNQAVPKKEVKQKNPDC
jgi:hypothetical protein